MKTTLDLPESLVREIERRVAEEGRLLDDVVAELLVAGMASRTNGAPQLSKSVPKRLPLIKVRPGPPIDPRKMTSQEWCDWLKEIDLQEDIERHAKTIGHQYVDRADA
jgi:hypothetical protein